MTRAAMGAARPYDEDDGDGDEPPVQPAPARRRLRLVAAEPAELAEPDAPRISRGHLVAKRTLDVVGAFALLLLILPTLLLIALAVKSTSRGPVFFRQRRLGRDGV